MWSGDDVVASAAVSQGPVAWAGMDKKTAKKKTLRKWWGGVGVKGPALAPPLPPVMAIAGAQPAGEQQRCATVPQPNSLNPAIGPLARAKYTHARQHLPHIIALVRFQGRLRFWGVLGVLQGLCSQCALLCAIADFVPYSEALN